MMKHALSGGHKGPIINVVGPGGSGKNYFAENMVSRRRTRKSKPLKEKAKGYFHRAKEVAGAVVGEIPLVGQHLEKGMRGHHAHKKKGGSYAFGPQAISYNHLVQFISLICFGLLFIIICTPSIDNKILFRSYI